VPSWYAQEQLDCFAFQVRITAVDIDPAMLEVATEYFDLVQDERLDVYIRDGAQFIEQAAEKGLGTCLFICRSSNSMYCFYIYKVPGLNTS
jgi:predicted membrane-bound spermidine synthase